MGGEEEEKEKKKGGGEWVPSYILVVPKLMWSLEASETMAQQ